MFISMLIFYVFYLYCANCQGHIKPRVITGKLFNTKGLLKEFDGEQYKEQDHIVENDGSDHLINPMYSNVPTNTFHSSKYK